MEKIKLSPWEILTLVVFSILLNQLISSYEAYTLVYITNAIFLALILSKLIKKTSNQSKQKNELTLALAKLDKLNEKTFEKFIITLLKKYAFHSINKFDVKDDSDNISDSYLLAQRDGVFYEIRTFATRKELSEKHINRITNKFRDSPTQIDNRILFINSVATDQVKNLIDNSGITLNTIDAVKISDLIHVVEPSEAVPITRFKVNLAHSIDNVTNMLNALKVKLVGIQPVNLSNKSIEQALNETIITEVNSRSVAEESEPTTTTNDNITSKEQNPEPTTVASNDNATEVCENPVNTSSVDEVANNEENTSEQEQAESNTKDESLNTLTGTETKDQQVEISEDDQANTNTDDDTSEEYTVISEDELNEIDIGTTEDFNFESPLTTSISPAIDMSEFDEFPTESGNSDDNLLVGGDKTADDTLLSITQTNHSETENTPHEDTDNTASNENAVAQDINSSVDTPLKSDNTTIGPTEIIETQQSTNDENTCSVKVVDQTPDQDDELTLMLTAQESSLSINNCENFDNEGNTTLTQTPTEFTLDYSEADISHIPTEMTQDDILAMSLIAEQDEIENEISLINTEAVVKIKIEQEAENKDESFQTASDDLLLGSTNDQINTSETPSVVETEKPKRKRSRGKNKA